MPEREHIDLETLEKYVLGKLAEKEAEAVRRHLESCTRCGLELKRLMRFGTVDSDEDLARKGEWLYARTKLEKAFREKIAPSAAASGAREVRFPRAARVARWLVPAVAATLGIFMIAHYTMNGKPGSPAPGPDVMRGVPPVEYEIALTEPVGEIQAPPAVFRWQSRRNDSRFALEIFTPSLETVCRADDINGSSWKAPDSLATILKPGAVYLWSVKGYEGLARATASPNGWFRIRR